MYVDENALTALTCRTCMLFSTFDQDIREWLWSGLHLIGFMKKEFKLGNYTGAIEYYNKILSLYPDHTWYFDKIAQVLKSMKNDTGAINYIDKYLVSNPDSVDMLRQKVLIYLNHGNYSEALKIYDNILSDDLILEEYRINANDLLTLKIKGFILSKLGNNTAAIESFDKVLNLDQMI